MYTDFQAHVIALGIVAVTLLTFILAKLYSKDK